MRKKSRGRKRKRRRHSRMRTKRCSNIASEIDEMFGFVQDQTLYLMSFRDMPTLSRKVTLE
ncbi:unnamed protein product [Prunus armeniaca]|uniref:Uncharacterized protein n=1 Tax=Prunus armeniaca TaxID=36596 RepID=A0A6J5Y562_PRUAR|nr:unnamed protein product [Prunus armeniaca]CAB4319573.1 unnamed protein product [Prunus armeniaca]